ncbi:MAG: carboxylesterase family protein, partial [Acidimicrobiia bacterium]|nr:carboxylesterase family protein [Acidimicrobiia bacterium]
MSDSPAAEGPISATTLGAVRGRHRRGVELYAGIPYAAPPHGAARFQPPRPAESWSGVRDAVRFSPAAPQLPGEGLTNSVAIAWDEAACLTVNVTTPAADGAGRPVLVWIHGGDFKNGTGATPWYDGTAFAANGDVVVVSLNYRLGAFGFCRLDDAPSSGVLGLLDQLAALEWVQHNISSFGGDPSRVTVAGESAGAFSVASLLAMPEATGLFQQAIIQSGGGHHVHTHDDARAVTAMLHDEAATDDLRSLDADRLLAAQQRVQARSASELGLTMSPFYPSVGGEHLHTRPIDLVAAGASADIPVLIGTNADEASLFGVGAVTHDRLSSWVGRFHADPAAVIDVYRR